MKNKSNIFWSPYTVGAGIGLLSIATIYFMNKTLGASTFFVHMVGALELAFVPHYAEASSYLNKILAGQPFFDWQVAMIVGLFAGASLSAYLYTSYQTERVPALWRDSFGPSFNKRAIGAFIGGFFILYGARLAGGCTSGKAISGGLQLGTTAWLFMMFLFVTGSIISHIIYRKN